MARYALIDKRSQIVVNVIEWDGDLDRWEPPGDFEAMLSNTANIGDTVIGTTVTPRPPEPVDQQRLDDLATCKAFVQATSPTAVQTVTAVKSVIRLLRSVAQELQQ